MGRYLPTGHGLLDPFARGLFLLGLLAAAWKWRQTALWWVMFLLPVYTIQVFSSQTPDAARGLIVAPFMFLFVGLGIEMLLKGGHWVAKRIRGTGVAVAAVLSGAAIVFAGADVHLYFDWIDSPNELHLRAPDVSVAEFPLWKSLELQAAHAGGSDFDFAKWCTTQDVSSTTADPAVAGLCSNFAPDLMATCLNASDKTPIERDQQRLSDMNSLDAALQQYHHKYAAFPSTAGAAQPLCIYSQRDAGCKLQEFLQPLPKDLMASLLTCRGYMYSSDGDSFTLYAGLETGPVGEGTCPSVPPPLVGVQYLQCFSGP
jgi:hypothetical protein